MVIIEKYEDAFGLTQLCQRKEDYFMEMMTVKNFFEYAQPEDYSKIYSDYEVTEVIDSDETEDFIVPVELFETEEADFNRVRKTKVATRRRSKALAKKRVRARIAEYANVAPETISKKNILANKANNKGVMGSIVTASPKFCAEVHLGRCWNRQERAIVLNRELRKEDTFIQQNYLGSVENSETEILADNKILADDEFSHYASMAMEEIFNEEEARIKDSLFFTLWFNNLNDAARNEFRIFFKEFYKKYEN